MTIPKIKSLIEHAWTTDAGKRACIKLIYSDSNVIRHRCGYVETNLKDLDYHSNISVHGGLTYCGVVKDFSDHAVGFDCMHAWDNSIEDDFRQVSDGEIRSFDYCYVQCEKLAEQLHTMETSAFEI